MMKETVFKALDLARIRTVPIAEIGKEVSFFDSLRKDYHRFDEWFARVAKMGREAWVIDSELMSFAGLCIFKIEESGEPVIDSGASLPGKFLKLCTFKIRETGFRYGERLLYAAFQFAITNHLTSVYVQVRRGCHHRLVRMLKTYGFYAFGQYKEDVSYVKKMLPGPVPICLDDYQMNLKYDITYYPYHLDGSNVRKFLVSLTQAMHDNLFPDARMQTLAFPLCDKPVIGEAHAICKAVVQNGIRTSVRPGDLLFFYVKGIDRHVDCMGMVEDYFLCLKQSRIPDDVVDKLPCSFVEGVKLMGGNDMMIITFRLLEYLSQPISRKVFTKNGFETNHRSIRQIPEDIYITTIKPRLRGYGVSG